jgi:ComF family protein
MPAAPPGQTADPHRAAPAAANGPLNPFVRAVAYMARNFRDFVYPPLCIICDNPLRNSDPWLCPECLGELAANASSRNACPRCGQNRDRHECACELAWDYPFECVFSIFDFDDTVRAIAHQVKYQGKRDLAFHIGKRFACRIPAEFLDSVDMMTPVPLHFRRRLSRGYNQAECFARGVAAGLGRGIPLASATLKRTRHTRTQTKLDKEERERNLQNAFAVAPKHVESLRGRNVILVDDVVTTGATTGHCAQALLSAGAKSVRVLSLARD